MFPIGTSLRLARDLRGKSQRALSTASGVSVGQISRFELDDTEPSAEELAALALALDVPNGFLTKPSDFVGSVGEVHFRRKSSTLVGERKRVIAFLNIASMLATRLDEGFSDEARLPLEARRPRDFAGGPAHAASTLRKSWCVPPGPIQNLTRLVEEAGVAVFHTELGPDVQGASCWAPNASPVIVINASMPGDRIRWTTAHELGHLYLHAVRRDGDTMEDEANEFAAEFLMPGSEIRGSLTSLSVTTLADLKREWAVAMQALINRAHSLGTMSDYERKQWFISFQKRGWRKSEPEPIPAERPSRMSRLVAEHADVLGSWARVADRFSLPSDAVVELTLNGKGPDAHALRVVHG